MPTAAVTGATGFLGRHLIPLLTGQGYQVRALARLTSRLPPSVDEVEVVPGDVRSSTVVQSLANGCDALVHLAPGLALPGQGPDAVLEGARNVVMAAQAAGVQRLVYLSCLGADSAAPPALAALWKAETVIRASPLPFVILRPSLILGRGDGFTAPLASLIQTLPVVPVPGDGQQRQQPIDVEDVARCVLTAVFEDSLVGQTVALGGPSFLTFRQLVDLVSGRLGTLKPKLLVPYRLLPSVTRLLPAAGRSLYSPARVAQLRQGGVASPGIVQRSFGFEPRSIPPHLSEYLA